MPRVANAIAGRAKGMVRRLESLDTPGLLRRGMRTLWC